MPALCWRCTGLGGGAAAAPGPRAGPSTADVLPTPAQILAVPPALLALLREQVIDPGYSREQRLQRLVRHDLRRSRPCTWSYDPDATQTMSETWQTRRANCLSFTLLFVTLAALPASMRTCRKWRRW